MSEPYAVALGALGAVMGRIDDAAVDEACALIARSKRIVLYGLGREGLQIRGFCMRLFHMGRDVAMAFDMTTPPLGPGDLFITSAGPGDLSTGRALAEIAKAAGADILFLTAQPGERIDRIATQTLVIPAQTMADDQGAAANPVLPMGSIYEGALFVLFEVMVFKLKAILGVTAEDMRARHTNME